MQTSEETKDLLAAMLAAKQLMKPVRKGGVNTFDDYPYSQEIDWWRAIEKHLEANELLITFSILEVIELGPTISGKQTKTRVIGRARISHSPTGQWQEVRCAGDGADKGDKAVFKAITGFKKYGYSLLLCLPTSADPERDDPDARSAAKPAAKPKAAPKTKEPVSAELRKEVQDYIRDHFNVVKDLKDLPGFTALLGQPDAPTGRVKKGYTWLKKEVRDSNKGTNERLEAKIHLLGREVYGKAGKCMARMSGAWNGVVLSTS